MGHPAPIVFLAVATAALVTVGFGATAGAGIVVVPASTLTIVKTVSGPVPEGTTFTVSIDCNLSIIDNGLSGPTTRP